MRNSLLRSLTSFHLSPRSLLLFPSLSVRRRANAEGVFAKGKSLRALPFPDDEEDEEAVAAAGKGEKDDSRSSCLIGLNKVFGPLL